MFRDTETSRAKRTEIQRTCLACKRLLNPPRSDLRELQQTRRYTRITFVRKHFTLNQELGRSQVNRPRQQKTSEENNTEDRTARVLGSNVKTSSSSLHTEIGNEVGKYFLSGNLPLRMTNTTLPVLFLEDTEGLRTLSCDHLPATSAIRTTSGVRPWRPERSRYRRSFSRCATYLHNVDRELGCVATRRQRSCLWHVSPRPPGSPRDVRRGGWHGDVLRMLMVATPPPSSRQTRAPADSTATPSLLPKTLHHSTHRTLAATKNECTATQGASSDGREGRGKSEWQARSVLPLSSPQTAHSPQGRFGARRKSQDSCGNVAHMPVTLSVPVYCHPSRGVEKSWPKVGEGRSPVASSSHCGATNPQSKSMSRAVTTPAKREPRLRSCSAQTMVAATSGCPFCTISKQSLQLARLVAARMRLALRTPTQGQQRQTGNVQRVCRPSVTRQNSEGWSKESSCCPAWPWSQQPEIGPGRGAEQQQQPCCLQIAHCWNPLQAIFDCN